MIPQNKKGQVQQFVDFVFLFLFIILLWVFFSVALFGGVKKSHAATHTAVGDFKKVDTALNNLNIQTEQGVNLENADLDKKIAESKLLEGKVITGCQDYTKENDCKGDTVNILKSSKQASCAWVSKRCMLQVHNAKYK